MMLALIRSRFRPLWTLAAATLTALCVLLLVRVAGDVADNAAFELDQQVVSTARVERYMNTVRALYGLPEPSGSREAASLRGQSAKALAIRMLLHEAAVRRSIHVGREEVMEAFKQFLERAYPHGGRAAFVAALGTFGASQDQVLSEVRHRLEVAALFAAVARDIEVTDRQLQHAFRLRQAAFRKPERRHVLNIVVRSRPEAVRLLQRLHQGASFEMLARRHSLDTASKDDGGDLRVASARRFVDSYARVAFDAREGQMFGPVRTRHGWNVGMVRDIHEARTAKFDDVENALRASLVARRAKQRWKTWLSLRIEAADISYAEAYRPHEPQSVGNLPWPSPSVALRPGARG